MKKATRHQPTGTQCKEFTITESHQSGSWGWKKARVFSHHSKLLIGTKPPDFNGGMRLNPEASISLAASLHCLACLLKSWGELKEWKGVLNVRLIYYEKKVRVRRNVPISATCLSTLITDTLDMLSLPGSKRLAGAKNSFWTKRSTRSPTVQFVVPQSNSNSQVGLFPVWSNASNLLKVSKRETRLVCKQS